MLFIIILIPLIVGIGVSLLFMFLLENRYPRGIAAMTPLLFVWAVFGSVALVYGFGAGIFGPSLSCLPIAAAAIALLVFIFEGFRSLRRFGGDTHLRQWLLVDVFLIPLLLIAPVVGKFAITSIYDAENRVIAGSIIDALATYQTDHGDYPEDLGVLVPDALPEIPTGRGFGAFAWFHEGDDYAHYAEFDLVVCDDVTLVTISSLKLDFIQRYNVTTEQWSRASFLDGVCDYLR